MTYASYIRSVSVLFAFVFLSACSNNNDTVALNYTAYSSDSKHIFFLNKDRYEWILDSRWSTGKYSDIAISPSGQYLAYEQFPYGTLIIKNANDETLVKEEMK